MNRIVAWLAQRRYRMILLTAAFALLPLLSLVSQAIVVFAVLLRGLREGLLVALAASGLLVLSAMLRGAAEPAVIVLVALANWVPAIVLAVVLQRSRSLSMTVQVATVVVAVGVTAFFMFGTPIDNWRTLLTENFSTQLSTLPDEVVTELSRIMTGLAGGMTLLATLAAVFVARWWQSGLQKPGAFGAEFRGLRLGTLVGLIAAVIFLAAGLTRLAVLENLTLVFMSGFLLHGLAVMHAYVYAAGTSVYWLTAAYGVLIILAMPFVIVVAGLGFLDNWFNFRSRFADR